MTGGSLVEVAAVVSAGYLNKLSTRPWQISERRIVVRHECMLNNDMGHSQYWEEQDRAQGRPTILDRPTIFLNSGTMSWTAILTVLISTDFSKLPSSHADRLQCASSSDPVDHGKRASCTSTNM